MYDKAESTGPDGEARLGSSPMGRPIPPPDDDYTAPKPGETPAAHKRRLESRLGKVGPEYEDQKARQLHRQWERDAIIRVLHNDFGVSQPSLATIAGTTRQNVSLITPTAEERKRREDENTKRKLARRRGTPAKRTAAKR